MIAISGVKNSGKTTFLEKLIPELLECGLKRQSSSTTARFCPGCAGTDSSRLRCAGACGTAVFSRNRWMLAKDEPGMDEARLAQLFPEADLILLEGMKDSAYPKIELVRGAVSGKASACRRRFLRL